MPARMVTRRENIFFMKFLLCTDDALHWRCGNMARSELCVKTEMDTLYCAGLKMARF